MLQKLIKLNQSDFAVMGGILAGTFLVIQIITAAVMLAVRPESDFIFSPLAMPIVAGATVMLFSTGTSLVCFETGLTFSVTRRRMAAQVLALVMTETVFAFGLSTLLVQLDRAIAYGVWANLLPGLAVEDTIGIFPWWGVAGGALLAPLLGFIMAALIQRFGRRALWGLWGAWMLFLMGGQLLPGRQSILLGELIPAFAVGGAALLVWSVWSMLHAAIRR